MTLAELKARLVLYLAAETKILEGNQSITLPGGTSYGRADLGQIRAEISRLRMEIDTLENGGSFGCRPVIFGGRR